MLFKGSIKSSDFGGFIIILLKHYSKILNRLHNYVFCLDNASIHKAKILIPL